MKHPILPLTLSAALVLMPFSAQAAVFRADENPSVTSEVRDDLFTAGTSVSVKAPVFGELFAAGENVTITERPERSAFVAGSTVTVKRGAGYNAFAAGSVVTLSGEYGHDVYAAGSTVTIEEGTVIHGDLVVAGSTVNINGTIDGDVRAFGPNVISAASIAGSMYVETDSLRFEGGRVGGDLTYSAEQEAQNLAGVTIAGKTVRNEQSNRAEIDATATYQNWFFSLLGMLIVGAATLLFFRKKSRELPEVVLSQWGSNWLTGAVALILTPILSILLFVTIIGIPLAIILLLGYILGLIFATLFGAMAAGRWLLVRFGDADPNPWAVLLVGVVGIAILRALPIVGLFIGLVFMFALVIPALGALILWYRSRLAE